MILNEKYFWSNPSKKCVFFVFNNFTKLFILNIHLNNIVIGFQVVDSNIWFSNET